MLITPTQNFHVVTLPTNPENPLQIVKQAVDNNSGDVLGTLKASIAEKSIYPKGSINRNFLVSPEDSVRLTKPHIYVEDLIVNHASRNKGVGRALITDIAKESKTRGFKGVLILLAGSNEDSPLPFYKKLGFLTTSKNLNTRLDYAAKYRSYISNTIQEFMTLSADAAKALIKSAR